MDMKNCHLCPRECGVNREIGEIGYCKTADTLILARAALHMWEEPCISGENGSGTVFFSGCSMGCVFCQNKNIATAQTGKKITIQRLSEIFLELQQQGAHNINLVTPSHYTLQIIDALKIAKSHGLKIPIIYNSSGYEKVDTLKLLDGLIDIYLPDFKYMDDQKAQKYSNAKGYSQHAKNAIHEMVRQIPQCIFNNDGIMKKGIVIRHLILPNNLEDSKEIIKYLYKTYGNNIFLSIMNQYTPKYNSFPELNRTIRSEEYDEIIDYAIHLGIENGFIQGEGTADESFIPQFDCEGI